MCVVDLNRPCLVGINADRVMQAESAFKVGVALEVFRQASAARLDLAKRLHFGAQSRTCIRRRARQLPPLIGTLAAAAAAAATAVAQLRHPCPPTEVASRPCVAATAAARRTCNGSCIELVATEEVRGSRTPLEPKQSAAKITGAAMAGRLCKAGVEGSSPFVSTQIRAFRGLRTWVVNLSCNGLCTSPHPGPLRPVVVRDRQRHDRCVGSGGELVAFCGIQGVGDYLRPCRRTGAADVDRRGCIGSLGQADRLDDGELEVVPGLVEVEVAVPRLMPALR